MLYCSPVICCRFLSLALPPMVTSYSVEVNVTYQDNITIFCTALSLTSDVSITWSTSAIVTIPITTTVPLGNDLYMSSLTLTDVSLDATGVYTCTVESSFGYDSEDIVVNVEGL